MESRREFIDGVWRNADSFARAFFPHRWQMPPGVYGPEEFLPPLFAQYAVQDNPDIVPQDICNLSWLVFGEALKQYGTRVYHAERALVESFRRTDPSGFTFDALRMPLPAFMVMLPHGSLSVDRDGDVLGIGFARLTDRLVIVAPLASACTYTFTCKDTDEGLREQLERDDISLQRFDSATEELLTAVRMEEGETTEYGVSEVSDSEQLHRIVKMGLNLLAYLSSRSGEELVTPEQVKRKAKKHSKPNPQKDRPFLVPFTIGERYTRGVKLGSATGPTGRTVKLHWRAGHWRRQRYGKGYENIKLVHIEPVLVGVK